MQQQQFRRSLCCQHSLSAPLGHAAMRLRALGTPRRHGPSGSRTATQAVAEAEGIVHISESAIVLGSTVIALGAPFVFNQFRRVSSVSASDAALLVDGSTLVVDVRSKEEIKVEGAPLLDKLSSGWDRIIFAPWFKEGTTVQNPSFVDDILLSPGIKDGTSIIVMDASGTIGQRAANLLSRTLGERHDVFLMSGGFKAWKKANLPYNVLTMREEEEYGQAMLTDGGRTWVVPEVAASYDGASGGAGAAAMAMQQQAPGLSLADVLAKLPFHPRLLDVLAEGYTMEDLKRDVLSGGVVGVVALSLSMALGIASESTPAVGLYTAVIAGFLTSALGGSRVGIGGPTAAFIPIVVGVAHQYGPENLITCTAMAGAILISMSLLGLGSVIKFVPRPVVTGFTAGIAAYIFSTQVKDFLGLGVPGHLPEGAVIPSEFLEKLIFLGSHIPGTHGPSLALAGACLGVMLAWPKPWAKVVPSQIVAVVVGTAALALVDGGAGIHTGIETIGSHFGPDAIPTSLPMPKLPDLRPEVVQPLIYPACTIALLAAIESLLCARVADTMIDDRHDPNAELFAQGVANIASASFGGLPATGALARTAANVRSGGRTPIAGMVHATVVALVILVASPLALHIPLPVLSAVLVIVALNMGEWENFKALPSWPERDAQLFIVSFLLTVLQDVAVAVELGMAAALLLFVKDVTQSFYVRALPPDTPLATLAGISSEQLAAVASGYNGNGNGYSSAMRKMQLKVPDGTAYIEVTGSLLFGAGEVLEHAVEQLQVHGPVHAVVLHMGHVGVMDVSGLEVMEEQLHRLHKANVELILCGLARQPLHMLAKVGFLDAVGRTNVCRSIDEALVRAQQLVAAAEAKVSVAGSFTDVELEPEEAVELPANMAFYAKEYETSHSDGATSRDDDDDGSPAEEEAVEGAWAPQAQAGAGINGGINGGAHGAMPLPEPSGAAGW